MVCARHGARRALGLFSHPPTSSISFYLLKCSKRLGESQAAGQIEVRSTQHAVWTKNLGKKMFRRRDLVSAPDDLALLGFSGKRVFGITPGSRPFGENSHVPWGAQTPLFLHKVERTLELEFELRALRQIQLMSEARRNQEARRSARGGTGSRAFAASGHATAGGADGGSGGSRLEFFAALARARLDFAFFAGSGFDAVVAGHAHNLGDNRQLAEGGLDVVKGEPDACAARGCCRFHAADVPANFGAWPESCSIGGFEGLQGGCFEFLVLF